jgi:hypothetical protein
VVFIIANRIVSIHEIEEEIPETTYRLLGSFKLDFWEPVTPSIVFIFNFNRVAGHPGVLTDAHFDFVLLAFR